MIFKADGLNSGLSGRLVETRCMLSSDDLEFERDLGGWIPETIPGKL